MGFHPWGVPPRNGRSIRENPIKTTKTDDLGLPPWKPPQSRAPIELRSLLRLPVIGVANGGAADGERLSTGSLTIGQDGTVHALQLATDHNQHLEKAERTYRSLKEFSETMAIHSYISCSTIGYSKHPHKRSQIILRNSTKSDLNR